MIPTQRLAAVTEQAPEAAAAAGEFELIGVAVVEIAVAAAVEFVPVDEVVSRQFLKVSFCLFRFSSIQRT